MVVDAERMPEWVSTDAQIRRLWTNTDNVASQLQRRQEELEGDDPLPFFGSAEDSDTDFGSGP